MPPCDVPRAVRSNTVLYYLRESLFRCAFPRGCGHSYRNSAWYAGTIRRAVRPGLLPHSTMALPEGCEGRRAQTRGRDRCTAGAEVCLHVVGSTFSTVGLRELSRASL